MAIVHPPGAAFTLVSDDQILIEPSNGALEMTPPSAIAGRLEVRGLGIFTFPFQKRACIRLIVRLTGDPIERLPDTNDLVEYMHKQAVRRIWLNPFEASAPAKIALALNRLTL